MPRTKKGFTLIELVVVIAIISILAMAGLPTYKKYRLRANVSDGTSMLNEYKKSLAILWNTEGKLPSANVTLPGPVDLPFNQTVTKDLSSNIESISLFKVNNGIVIKLVYSLDVFPETPANNRTLCLGAKVIDDQLRFRCGNLSLSPQSAADLGFANQAALPRDCNYNGVSSWLATLKDEPETPQSPPPSEPPHTS